MTAILTVALAFLSVLLSGTVIYFLATRTTVLDEPASRVDQAGERLKMHYDYEGPS